jgi:hypothetical protein
LIEDGRRLTGEIVFSEDLPPHHLRIAGYAVKRLPEDRSALTRPCLSIPVGRGQFAVELAEATIELENAAAEAVWGEGGLLSCTVRLEPHRWKTPHADAALKAVRWLEQLSGRTFSGGSPKGPRKGQVWPRLQCLKWWKGWVDLDRIPTQAELAADMGLLDPETAVDRWRATGLHWPPTQEELDELEDD